MSCMLTKSIDCNFKCRNLNRFKFVKIATQFNHIFSTLVRVERVFFSSVEFDFALAGVRVCYCIFYALRTPLQIQCTFACVIRWNCVILISHCRNVIYLDGISVRKCASGFQWLFCACQKTTNCVWLETTLFSMISNEWSSSNRAWQAGERAILKCSIGSTDHRIWYVFKTCK